MKLYFAMQTANINQSIKVGLQRSCREYVGELPNVATGTGVNNIRLPLVTDED